MQDITDETGKSTHPEVLCKKDAPENFAKPKRINTRTRATGQHSSSPANPANPPQNTHFHRASLVAASEQIKKMVSILDKTLHLNHI